METQTEKRIIETSGRLLAENGPGAFSLDVLAKQPEMQGFEIFTLVGKEDQIYEQLFFQLTKELKEIVDGIYSGQNSPAEEFEMLFKQLHRLFKQKPYYLTIVFDKDIPRQYSGADKIISGIKDTAKKYLSGLITRGKAQKVFTTDAETEILVKEIIGSFQTLMNDMHLADKMVRDLQKYRSVTGTFKLTLDRT